MRLYLRRYLFILIVFTAGVFAIEYSSIVDPRDVATIYVRVRNNQDTFIVSLNSDFPDPNLVVSSKSFPNTIRADSMFISPSGEWLFALTVPTSNQPFPLTYTRVGQPFMNFSLYSYRESLSADGNYLFYISIDAAGLLETYNFLNLETGQLIELLGEPLTTPGVLAGITEAAVPVIGWTLNADSLIFTSLEAIPGGEGIGFYRMDLSEIDFSKSGSYPMPERTEIATFDPQIGAGYLSPDKKYLAYFQYASEQQQTINPEAPPTVNILELATGSIHTIYADNGERFENLMWWANGKKLVYLKRLAQEHSFEVYAYDPVNQERQIILLHLLGDILAGYPIRATICGDTLFYTASDPQYIRSSVLYSVGLEGRVNNQHLLVGDSIDIISCSPASSWNPGRVTSCVPYCTPIPNPAIGDNLDIMTVNWDGGDPVNGQVLYSYLGCEGCHDAPIAPRLTGIYTRVQEERLTDPLNAGQTPEQYLAQSIVQPDAYIVPSYNAYHPYYYREQMSLGELRDLVAYLATQT